MGCYRYFDNQVRFTSLVQANFKGSWVQRKKPEFQFMYAYLEDDD
jgi:CCR4-NOT transcriptional regulation complex NOT5 subunit